MMSALHQRLSIPFGYDVIFTRGLFDPEGDDALARWLAIVPAPRGRHRILACVDDGLEAAQPGLAHRISEWAAAHADLVELVAPPRLVPGGERIKNGFAHVKTLLEDIHHHRICRQSYVLIAGGGAVLDAVGLAASLAHRGVRQIRVPSTVLAQNDSGVGVKNGVNLFGKKNFAGVFAPPAVVFDDLDLLESLSDRDWIAGTSEAFKVAIIKDRAFFDWLVANARGIPARDPAVMERLVRRCAELHVEHIGGSGDPFEQGAARPLDFGHWSAHRLEALTGYALRHGEAVAIGIALDTEYAVRVGRLTREEGDIVHRALVESGLPVWHDALERADDEGRLVVLEGLREFQEHLGGELTVTLPDGLGRKVEVHEMDELVLERCVRRLRALAPADEEKLRS